MCPYRSILIENILIYDPSRNFGSFETPETRPDILQQDENGKTTYIQIKYPYME